jgi:hypothetical protein
MLKLHLGRFLTNEGGIGGLVGLSLGWIGVKEDVEEEEDDEDDDESPGWMRNGKVSCADEVEADIKGKVLPDERGGVRIAGVP